ncbi:uncharacterized protein LOC143461697 [Clavelina lepadiformis]|uniref:uncharacterized protein LOC143461697 n=1 Tax=Clavelina lepadiformis TaxID=159417 RepID=UPI0040420C24
MVWKLNFFYNKPGSGEGEFEYARGLSVSPHTGNVIIGDINNKRIQILDDQYNYVTGWKIKVNESLLCPHALHRVNNEILAATIEGYTTLWHCPDVKDLSDYKPELRLAFGNDYFVFPRAISTTRKGHLVVSDVGKHRISLHDLNGTLIRDLGKLGTDDATEFNWPYYVNCDATGRIMVSDSHNRCVKLFDEDLRFLGSFGKDVFTCCTGVNYLDQHGGRYFVGDYDSQSFIELSKEGKVVDYIARDLKYPLSQVEFDQQGRIVTTCFPGFYVYSEEQL